MADRHISMRGEMVDFNRLRLQNSKKPALGNASMNARGDIVDPTGVVLKTQEQIEAEWAYKIAEQKEISQTVNIKDSIAPTPVKHPTVTTGELQHPPGLEPKVVDTSDADFNPEPVAAKPRRKIIESDE